LKFAKASKPIPILFLPKPVSISTTAWYKKIENKRIKSEFPQKRVISHNDMYNDTRVNILFIEIKIITFRGRDTKKKKTLAFTLSIKIGSHC
jgi:hypothetical protein